MLQLARASRATFTATTKYRLLRIRELDIMRTIAFEEYQESQGCAKAAGRQVGEVRNILTSQGLSLFEDPIDLPLRLSPIPSCAGSDVSDSDVDSEFDSVSQPLLNSPVHQARP